jgi:hypothetical protein
MSYGIQVQTSEGFVDINDATSGRIVKIYQIRAVSGSVTITDFDDAVGFYYVMNRAPQPYVPYMEFNNSTKVFSWVKNNAYPTANIFCDIYFIHL